jgi:hypothetical protein
MMDVISVLDQKNQADSSDVPQKLQPQEFLRNFFIKFGMKKTLDQFQEEWFELKANNKINLSQQPPLPDVYKVNSELSDELSALQQELDEARITAEKARSTYDKLRK